MRALIVAYYFPPKGGAGTQRFAKFCKYLPEHGIECVVMTVAADSKSPYAPNDDATLLRDSSTTVLRVSPPTQSPFGLRVRRALRLHTDEDEWAWAAAEQAVRLAKAQQIDVVVTTLSPYANYRIGERLQQELGIPWVVDLRDPWALDGWRVYATSLHARADLATMRRAIRGADFVIANVPAAKQEFVRMGANPARTVVIPNGFDEEDFAPTPAARQDGPFRLVHVGTLHGVDVGEGMTKNRLRRVRHRQIAPLGRTGNYLLRGVAAWRQSAGANGQQLAVHLYGQVDDSHRALIAQLGLADVVTLHGYVDHRASIAALLAADAVFVPLHDIPVGERALVVPGKLYEALASERPVLAALPPGDGVDLITKLDAGIVVPPTDAEALARAIGRLQTQRPKGVARLRLLPFTRRHLTTLLARVLQAAVAREKAVEIVDPWQQVGISPPGGTR